MASTTLYPPLVDSYTAAFIPSVGDNGGVCRVYYSLSKFSSPADEIKAIHFLITKQSSGENVVNRLSDADNHRFRSAGVLMIQGSGFMNKDPKKDNVYWTDIVASDVLGGWQEGWIYKIQIRFSKQEYLEKDYNNQTVGQAAFLNSYADQFSEWSTYTITKAISEPVITIPLFNYDSSTEETDVNKTHELNIFSSTVDVSGAYYNRDADEVLYSYKVRLKDADNNIKEESELFYANQFIPNQFSYTFKSELENSQRYVFELDYETLNKYADTITIPFNVQLLTTDIGKLQLLTAEDPQAQPYTSVREEEEDGRVGLKLYLADGDMYIGNVCIRRADSRTNFTIWDDIAFVKIEEANVNDMPIIYDYTAESGVWYQYGLQFLDLDGYRSALVKHFPIKREYDYAFILGENGKQLRLEYNHTINSFKTNLSDSKLDTIGGQYPFITRNGNMKYKTYPITGLISFNMDEDNLFTTMKDIYKYDEVVDLYKQEEFTMYDYTYERDFRNYVIEFLQDGKAKLFKSPTEGNIIVRLMDVNTTPDAKLGRLISNFSANAHEIATANYKNYVKYGFCTPGEFIPAEAITETRFGQLMVELESENDNIIGLICEKYNKSEIIDTKEEVSLITNLDIYCNGGEIPTQTPLHNSPLGFIVSSTPTDEIKVFGDYYNFSGIKFTPTDNMSVKASHYPIEVLVNFTYTVKIMNATEKKIKSKTIIALPGQIAKAMLPGESVMNLVSGRYFYDWDDQYSILREMNSLIIQADENTVFDIIDANDVTKFDRVIMNETCSLNLTSKLPYIQNVVYVGKVIEEADILNDPNLAGHEGEINFNPSAKRDVWIDFIVKVEKGVYA